MSFIINDNWFTVEAKELKKNERFVLAENYSMNMIKVPAKIWTVWAQQEYCWVLASNLTLHEKGWLQQLGKDLTVQAKKKIQIIIERQCGTNIEQSLITVKEQSKTVKWDAMEEWAQRWCSSTNTAGLRDLLLGPRSDHYDGYEEKNDHHQHPCRRKIRERTRLNSTTTKTAVHRWWCCIMILLLVCFIKLTHLSNLFLSGTWGPREKNDDLFYLWRLLLLDRRICACSCHLWINLYGSTDLALTILVKIQMSSSRVGWSWFETDSERRDVEQAQGKTHLEEVRSLRTWFQSPPSDTGSTSVDTLAAYHQLSLDDLMQFTCIRQPQKLYYCRLHTVMGMCFWFSLERIIIVLQRKNVQKLTHTSSKGFYPWDLKILVFTTGAAHEEKKKKLCC